MTRLRLGAISFVNTIPVYSNYQPSSTIELAYDVPARLNARMLAGELDISPVSSACYLRNQDKLVLLDDLSVSSPGAVESVLFISEKPLGPGILDVPTISVPNDSETSVMLLAYLLKEATGRDLRPWFKVYEANHYRQALQETGNALVIGDNALLAQESSLNQDYFVYDLSSQWQARTGLPFVFAVWVANRAWAQQHPTELSTINHALCDARNRFFADASVFEAGLRLGQEKSSLPKETLARYYRDCLTYNLTADHQASLDLFETILHAADIPTQEAQTSNLELPLREQQPAR